MNTASIETPSGKWVRDENFPVASFLLSGVYRPHIRAFYAFARTADDVADSSMLSLSEKLERLQALESTLLGKNENQIPECGYLLRKSLRHCGVTERHALDLLSAFRQDVSKNRYRDWEDLLDYCGRSAAPVGRFLLDLHAEDQSLYALSDPLCMALQILNHIQDCGSDHRHLDRVYLPMGWFAKEGISLEALSQPTTSSGLRSVLRRALDGVEELLLQAQSLPLQLKDSRLALESGVVLATARRLSRCLAKQDPLLRHVRLSHAAFIWAGLAGLGSVLRGRFISK